jgi:hypothetical protein
MSEIATYITGKNLAATVMMSRAAQDRKRPIIITEGGKDRRVLRSALHEEAELIHGNGKEETIDTIRHLDIIVVSRWLAIVVDADFDRLFGVSHHEMVLCTDCHDLDCEHLRSYALVKLASEICSRGHCMASFNCDIDLEPLVVADAIRKKLLAIARPLGLLRYLSISNRYELNFKSIDHKKLLKDDELEIDLDKLVSVVYSNSKNIRVSSDITKSELIHLLTQAFDDWQVCQGHDLCAFFAIAVKKHWGIGKISKEEIERSIRLAYESTFFWSTNLGQSLRIKLDRMNALNT